MKIPAQGKVFFQNSTCTLYQLSLSLKIQTSRYIVQAPRLSSRELQLSWELVGTEVFHSRPWYHGFSLSTMVNHGWLCFPAAFFEGVSIAYSCGWIAAPKQAVVYGLNHPALWGFGGIDFFNSEWLKPRFKTSQTYTYMYQYFCSIVLSPNSLCKWGWL